jgi:DnaJ domain
MSCDCAQCRQHYRTLGIAYGIPSESEVEEAYHESVKQWHPDLYENYASLRADAEEHFKQIQVAWRELKAHAGAAVESPAESAPAARTPVDRSPVDSVFISPQSVQEAPALSFDGAPGCLVASQFTEEIKQMIADHLGRLGSALAIVDLAGARLYAAGYSQFFLLAASGIMARDARNIVSVLWYKDLGEITLIDKRKQGKPGLWQKLVEGSSGDRPESSLQIYRSNGTQFISIGPQVDERAKRIIYNFLLSKKDQAQL